MEYHLVAEISYTQHGDTYRTVHQVDLEDMEIDSKEAIQIVALKIQEALNLNESLYYDNSFREYPTDNEFYLETKPQGIYGDKDMYEVKLHNCLSVKGKLFELKPLEINREG